MEEDVIFDVDPEASTSVAPVRVFSMDDANVFDRLLADIEELRTRGPGEGATTLGYRPITMTLPRDFRITDMGDARAMLYGDNIHEPLYVRRFTLPSPFGKLADVSFHLRDESYRPTRQDRENAAILKQRLTFEDVMKLLVTMYEVESETDYPYTARGRPLLGAERKQNIVSVYVYYEIRSGRTSRPAPKPLYFPARLFRAGLRDGLKMTQLHGHMLQQLIDESFEEFTGDPQYDMERKLGDINITRLIPTAFGVKIYNPSSRFDLSERERRYTTSTEREDAFRELFADTPDTEFMTFVRGLTAAQQARIDNMKTVHGVPLRNMDIRRNGYCMFDTMAALSETKIKPDILIFYCGSPSPAEITVEKYATVAAHHARVNFVFHKFVANEKKEIKPVEFYQTLTNYRRTEHLMVCSIKDPNNSDESLRVYNHVFYMEGRSELEDAVPYEGNTIFVCYDLETVADSHCYNRPWALNLLAYRVPPTIVTAHIYDARDQQSTMQCLNVDTKEWVQALVDDHGTKIINPEITKCAKIYYDDELNALKYLPDFLYTVRECSGFSEVNIVLVGFNSSRFDNFLLVPFLTNDLKLDDHDVRIGIFGNSVLTLTANFGRGVRTCTFDLRRHLVGSLRSNCKQWGVPEGGEKGDLDHSVIQMCYDINPSGKDIKLDSGCNVPSFSHFIEANREKIELYCKQDVIATAVLHVIFKASAEFIVNQHTIREHGASLGMIAGLYKAKAPKSYDADDPNKFEMIGTIVSKKKLCDDALDAVEAFRRIASQGVDIKSVLPFDISKIESTTGREIKNEEIQHVMCHKIDNDGLRKIGKILMEKSDPYGRWKQLGQYLTRIGLCDKALEIVQAIRLLRYEGVRFDDEMLPFDITNVQVPSRIKIANAMLVTLMDEARKGEPKQKDISDLLWGFVGGRLMMKNMRPNVEQHPTLASFATMIFKMICKASDFEEVGGFRYDISAALRKHMCRAGRSESHIGMHTKDPIFILDVVSLYPTAMTCPLMKYALGYVGDNGKEVRCEYVTKYEPETDGKMTAGIWKVLIHKQPNGVVIPAKDSTGYYWDRDCSHDFYALLATPDVESLIIAKAEFEVIEGIRFVDSTTLLYKEYIDVFQNEKGRQDQLKKGKPVKIFDTEVYSDGIREACKLLMNILSGKQLTRPYTKKRTIVHNEATVNAAEMVNEQKQTKLTRDALNALHSPLGQDLTTWRRKITKAEQIPRLTEPPTKIGDNTWIAEWREIPKAASYSHINGYHIYAVARWIMTQVYLSIGYDRFFVTETDSLAVSIRDIPKLYGLKSVFGDPIVYAEDEIAYGLLKDAPKCSKSKQFGQLESETTTKLQEFICREMMWYKPFSKAKFEPIADVGAFMRSGTPELKKWLDELAVKEWLEDPMNLDRSKIKTITYTDSNEIILNEKATGWFGPYLAVAGKKIYLQYIQCADGKRKPLKARFKGLTFGQDIVVHPNRDKDANGNTIISGSWLFSWLDNMSREDKYKFVLQKMDSLGKSARSISVNDVNKFLGIDDDEEESTSMTRQCDIPPANIHRLCKEDIFDFLNDRVMYVIQSRVSESSTLDMASRQNIVLKTLKVRTTGPDEKGVQEIKRISETVGDLSLRAMARGIRTITDDIDDMCQRCDQHGSVILDFKAFCKDHTPKIEEPVTSRQLCKHVNRHGDNDCGQFISKGDYCENHQGYESTIDVSIYCEHVDKVGDKVVPCKELAHAPALLKGIHKCIAHMNEDKTVLGLKCLRRYTYRKNGEYECQLMACENAIKSGYQLCMKHHSENFGEKMRRVNECAKITADKRKDILIAIEYRTGERILNSVTCGGVCQYVMKKGRNKLCGKAIDPAKTKSKIYCRDHSPINERIKRCMISIPDDNVLVEPKERYEYEKEQST